MDSLEQVIASLNCRDEYDLLTAARMYGPDHAVCSYFGSLGNTGLSPFALAGISHTSPRGVLKRLQRNRCKLSMSFCETTCLPIVSPGWGSNEFKDYYEDDLNDWAVRRLEEEDGGYCGSFSDQEIDNMAAPHRLEVLLKRFGGPSWRRHCTKDFNPFRQRVASISEERWAQFQKLWAAARREQLRRRRGLV